MNAEQLRQLAEIFREEAERNAGIVVDRQCNTLRRISDRIFELACDGEEA